MQKKTANKINVYDQRECITKKWKRTHGLAQNNVGLPRTILSCSGDISSRNAKITSALPHWNSIKHSAMTVNRKLISYSNSSILLLPKTTPPLHHQMSLTSHIPLFLTLRSRNTALKNSCRKSTFPKQSAQITSPTKSWRSAPLNWQGDWLVSSSAQSIQAYCQKTGDMPT